jgi:hypothetical protein
MASALPTFTDKLNTTLLVYNMDYLDGAFACSTLSQLREVVPSPTSKVAIVGDVGDGTSALYQWVSASTDADDGLLTIAPSNGQTGRWIKGV